MITLEIPIDKIPYIRTIEGRKFKDGKWSFPDTAAKTLQQLGFIDSDITIEKKEEIQYEISPFLYGYQKEIANKALNEESYGIFMDTGTGKTIVGLEIASHFNKTIILCPKSVSNSAWAADFLSHFFEKNKKCRKKLVNCWGKTKSERIKALNSDANIFILNYDSFKICKNEIMKMKWDCMIVDESSVMKNMKSQITSDILAMTTIVPRRYVLSGTPCPNHNSEIFPQMKFIAPDLLGNNYYGFLAHYFHQDMSNPHIWFQTQEDKDRLFAKLSERAVFLKKEDCVDLPPKVFTVKQFDLGKEQRKHYDNMISDIKDNINSWSKFEFTAKLMKLREIISGFVIGKDKSVIGFKTNKDDVLAETLEEIGDKPVIVWCQFINEVDRLAEKFGGVGLTSKTKNVDKVIQDFQNGKIKLLFSHPKILGKGLTFVNCSYAIYYSLSFSFEEFKQSQDRIHRIGQENKCTYIILQAKDTIDTKIYSCLQRKSNAADELYLEMGISAGKNS